MCFNWDKLFVVDSARLPAQLVPAERGVVAEDEQGSQGAQQAAAAHGLAQFHHFTSGRWAMNEADRSRRGPKVHQGHSQRPVLQEPVTLPT